ncbi:MAG: fatty acid desaturase [Sporichthyaceae bacterium]
MTITANPSVRQVLAKAVQDPRYAAIAQLPVWSVPHIGLTAFAWALFVGSTAAYLVGPLPLIGAILLNQFALYVAFTPLHDAVHGAASSSVRVNSAVGTISGTLLLPGVSTRLYRTLHLEHHRWVGDKKRDPDVWFVHAPKVLLPVVFAGPEWIWAYWYATRLWSTRGRADRISFVAMLTIYVGVHVAFLASPLAMEFFLLWLVPHWLAFVVLVYVFAHIQHPHESNWQEAPFQSTVEVRGTLVGKAYWLGQTDHCIHHAMPHIPFHRYHRVWELSDGILRRQGIPERGLFRGPGPIDVPRAAYSATRTARVVEARVVGGAGIATFLLEGLDEDLPRFTPGSHIDVHLPSGRVRQYSLCNAPDGRYRIAVKPEAEGRGGSLEVHQVLVPGAEVVISVPRNNFELYPADRYVLVAGGIGITPLLSMAHHLWANAVPFDLHVCAADADSVPFRDELAAMPFAAVVQVHVDASPGRTSLNPAQALASAGPEAALYVCGPGGFMDWVAEQAVGQGWPRDAVHRESFAAAVLDVANTRPFDVVLARSGTTLHVPADRQILDVLAEHDIEVPWSCSQGVCGTCITPVLSGEVEHRDAVLSPEVRAANTCMALCVSRASGAKVVLDL